MINIHKKAELIIYSKDNEKNNIIYIEIISDIS